MKGRPVSCSSKRGRDTATSGKQAPPMPVTAVPVVAAATAATPAVPTVVYTPRPHIPTPDQPREDLTERLRKEFGLNIEDSEGDGSDSESSGPIGESSTDDVDPTTVSSGRNRANGPLEALNGPTNRSSTSGVRSVKESVMESWNEADCAYWERGDFRRDNAHRNSQL